MIQTFAFHRNYVTDLESLAPGITDPKEKARKIRRELKKLQGNTGTLMEYRIHTERVHCVCEKVVTLSMFVGEM